MNKNEIIRLANILKSNGFIYYICQMAIHYGKEENGYNKCIECNYKNEIGGEVDYESAFKRILRKEGITF